MKGTWTIFMKELRSYLHSPVAYVLAFVYLILAGYFFQDSMNYLNRYSAEYPMRYQQAMQMRQYGAQPPPPPNVDQIVIRRTYGVMGFLLIFIVPILTMRTYAEEYRSGTIELIWTSPVTAAETLAGKFLGTFALFLGILGLTLIYVGISYLFTPPDAKPDGGLILANYLGLILMGGAFISVGVFSSSLTENQIVAAVISFSALLFFLVIGAAADRVGNFAASEFLRYLSINGHMDPFLRGVISLRDIIYYLTFIGFMLFLTNRVLESRRWRL